MEQLLVNDLIYNDFKNIKLSFENGKFYNIVGPNNSGKTTLFKIMCGLNKTNNYITCDAITLNDLTRYEYIKKIGVVKKLCENSFQYHYVFDELSYPLHNLNYSKSKINKRINDVLDLFQMKNVLNKTIDLLNDYEKQKLLIVISLLHKPKVLLIDDALEIFSLKEQNSIMNVLKEFVKKGLCLIYFSHNLNNCLWCDEIILMNNNKIIKKMFLKEIIDNDKLFWDNNIEMPFLYDLNNKLNIYNVTHQKYDNIEEMVDDIWQ